MNVNLYNTTDYERKRDWTLGENKPNSNPNKPNLRRARMNINSFITKDYRKKDDFAVPKNKPYSNPIPSNFCIFFQPEMFSSVRSDSKSSIGSHITFVF